MKHFWNTMKYFWNAMKYFWNTMKYALTYLKYPLRHSLFNRYLKNIPKHFAGISVGISKVLHRDFKGISKYFRANFSEIFQWKSCENFSLLILSMLAVMAETLSPWLAFFGQNVEVLLKYFWNTCRYHPQIFQKMYIFFCCTILRPCFYQWMNLSVRG